MLVSKVIQRLLLVVFLVLLASESMAQVDSLLIQEGTASYYGRKFHGRKTASGEIFHLDSMTAAHKNLPWGTVIKVTNKKNGLSAVVRINDRLPSYSKRQIDLSSAAAEQIEMMRDGLVQVRIEAVDLDQLDRLVEYFSDKNPGGLRIRPYYRSIPGPEREWDKSLKKVNPSPSSLLFD